MRISGQIEHNVKWCLA